MRPDEFLTVIRRFWSYVERGDTSSCWPWTGETNNKGYGRLEFWHEGRRSRLLAHRVAFMLQGGQLGPKDKVLHRCDNPPCCNPGHLRKGTQLENMRDALAKGRMNLDGLALGSPTRWGHL